MHPLLQSGDARLLQTPGCKVLHPDINAVSMPYPIPVINCRFLSIAIWGPVSLLEQLNPA